MLFSYGFAERRKNRKWRQLLYYRGRMVVKTLLWKYKLYRNNPTTEVEKQILKDKGKSNKWIKYETKWRSCHFLSELNVVSPTILLWYPSLQVRVGLPVSLIHTGRLVHPPGNTGFDVGLRLLLDFPRLISPYLPVNTFLSSVWALSFSTWGFLCLRQGECVEHLSF